MRPNEQEVLQGIVGALGTYIMPELQTEHAKLEMMLISVVLGSLAGELDGAAQKLVDDNAALRELARRGAGAIANGQNSDLAGELRSLADETDASVRLSDLSAANDKLHAAIGRLGVLAEGSDTPALREIRDAVIGRLREEAESRELSLLGPRMDG